MRLIMVSRHWYEYSVGGTETYIKNFLRTAKPIFEKIIIVIPSKSNRKSIEKYDNVEIHKVPFIPIVGTQKKPTQKKSIKLFEYLDSLIKKENIDIIENQSISPVPSLFFSVFMAGMKNKIPVIERIHATPNNPTWNSILSDIGFSKILCVSKYLSEYIYRIGVFSKKLKTVYPGINTSKFKKHSKNFRKELGFKNNDIVILHASRIATLKTDKNETIEQKGITTLLKAFSISAEDEPHLKLMIAAAVPFEENMKYYESAVKKINNYSEIYGIKEKVKIIPVKYDDMDKAYNTCDIFAMLSKEETFGLVYAEAMSCEKAVIASSVCAMPELISNNETGYLVSPKDPVEISKRINWLVDDKEKRDYFGKNGRLRVIEKFEENKITNELKEAYIEIIKEYKKKNN